MPEMLKYAGKRFTVSHRVEKICDTVKTEGMPASRRMRDTLFLEDLRCDGSAHGGCQAGCRIYWKESWLRRVESETEPSGDSETGDTALAERATSATTVGGAGDPTRRRRGSRLPLPGNRGGARERATESV